MPVEFSVRHLVAAVSGLLLILTGAPPASAHPHIFVDARAKLVFNDAGAIEQLRHEWTFDPSFSAWIIQGLDTDDDGVVSSPEMQRLADENMVGLAGYQFYTYASIGERDLAFEAVGDQSMAYEDGRVTLQYSIHLAEPTVLDGTLELAVGDPEYYVAITIADASAVTRRPQGKGA
ncbi:MAG: DUF1007 family protein [Nitrococcus sp.]|nr:DUF1007 family protein [Nitrococcus sp.]